MRKNVLVSSITFLYMIIPLTIRAQNSTNFEHGCGTGCTVRASLTNVTSSGDGVSKGIFLLKGTGGGRGVDRNATSTATVTVLAKCSEGLISWNNSEWRIVDLSDSYRYTTSQGGIGYYFDAICQSSNVAQSPSVSSCEKTIELSKKRVKGALSADKIRMDARYGEFPQEKPNKLQIVYSLGDIRLPEHPNQATMIQISQQVLSACKDVSIVSFGPYRSDAELYYGVVNGKVRKFQCIQTSNTPRVVPWGFVPCF